jgi:hypothetical protein
MGALRNDLMYISGGGLYLTLTLTLAPPSWQSRPLQEPLHLQTALTNPDPY